MRDSESLAIYYLPILFLTRLGVPPGTSSPVSCAWFPVYF